MSVNPEVSQSRVILLIRHGDYKKWEEEDNQTLTPCGRQQAKNTGASVHNIPELPTVTNITASTMVRAKETAEIIGKEFPNLAIDLDSILKEGNPDEKMHRNRFEAVFKKYFVPASSTTKETNIIVCHGNLIRYLICR